MDVKGVRRTLLFAYIKTHFDDNVSRFAEAVGYRSSMLQDIKSGRKSFGEKLARNLEAAAKVAGLPAIGLPFYRDDGAIASPAATSAPSLLSKLEIELLEAFRALPARRRNDIVKDLAVEVMRKGKARPPSIETTPQTRAKQRTG